ncbi:MAG: VTT domain-containing protein, partial [Gemmatimonadota bacterium]|nr:VTT domain-containing protein [Gemmatimonadota bacterium]
MKAPTHSLIKLIVLGLIVVGGFLAVRLTPLGETLSQDGVASAIDFLRGSPWAPVIFVTAYATLTALAVPGTILTLAGGAVFGVFWGTVYNSIAANIGANAAFLLSRALGQDGVRSLLGSHSAALEKLDGVVERHGFRGLLTLRLIPLVPFNALNFGSGLLPLRWRTYAIATLVGIFPGTLVYTFFADALLQGSQEASRGALLRVAFAGALLILMSFLPQILKRLRISLPGAAAGLVLLAGLLPPSPARAQVTQDATSPVDHEAFSALLAEVVKPEGVDYEALKGLHPVLLAYVADLGRASEAEVEVLSTEARLAFWINAYNACMLKRVIDHYPIQSASGLFGRLRGAVA